jgi:predicted lipoprotein with Yx(FWY)xxD motif
MTMIASRIVVVAAMTLAQAGLGHAADVPPDVPADVIAKPVGTGWAFTDQKGMTLYTYARDEPGQSNCKTTCADAWPPFKATDATKTVADWSTIDRGDGQTQWAYKSQPLYTYVKDPVPGTTFGDGVGEAWHVAGQDMATPPEIAIGDSLLGRVLTDSHGMTLYSVETDEVKERQGTDLSGKGNVVAVADLKSRCAKRCLDTWRPMAAPLVAIARGDCSVVLREDGLRQWAFRNKPLYAYAGDLAVTETRGDGVERVWHAAVVAPTPPVPAWVTYQASDAGELLGDAKGLTIYAFTAEQNRARRSNLSAPATCDPECIRTFWYPVGAAADAKPVGNWSIVKAEDGIRQWAYKGEPIYLHSRDKKPGDITGTRFTGSRAWHPIMRSGQRMQGMGGN